MNQFLKRDLSCILVPVRSYEQAINADGFIFMVEDHSIVSLQEVMGEIRRILEAILKLLLMMQ